MTPSESRRDLLARVTETAEALHASQLDHWNAILDARDTEHRATLEELGRAMGIPAQTVRWRIRAARRDTGREDPGKQPAVVIFADEAAGVLARGEASPDIMTARAFMERLTLVNRVHRSGGGERP